MGNVQILLRQHVGAPCAAIVQAGDEVKKGTKIATPTGLGANIFSSVYGVVEEVLEDRIVIRPDEEQKEEFVPDGAVEPPAPRRLQALLRQDVQGNLLHPV